MSGADSFGVTECNIDAITISDHAPICLKLKMSPNNNFKYWRANVSILNKEIVKQELQKKILTIWNLMIRMGYLQQCYGREPNVSKGAILLQFVLDLKKERIVEQLKLENKIRALEREVQTTRKDVFLDKLKETRPWTN